MSKQGIKIINNALIREIQRLRFIKEMSYRDIGKELGVGKDTVAKALRLGDKTLQTHTTLTKSKSIRHKKPRITIAEEHELDIQKDIINEEKELHTALKIVKGKVGQALQGGDDSLLIKLLSPYVDILKTSGQLKKFNLTLVDARSQHLTLQNLTEADRESLKLELRKEMVNDIWDLLSEESRRALSE